MTMYKSSAMKSLPMFKNGHIKTAIVFFLLLLLFSGYASAEVYKCVTSEKTTYQDHPCSAASKSMLVKIRATQSMAGCYQIDFPGDEEAPPAEQVRVVAAGGGTFNMISISGKEKTILHMQNASAEDMSAVGSKLHLKVGAGISVKWDKGSANQKPIGLYRATDEQGNSVIFAYFFLSNGFAKEISCP